jgi:hypothetical protein
VTRPFLFAPPQEKDLASVHMAVPLIFSAVAFLPPWLTWLLDWPSFEVAWTISALGTLAWLIATVFALIEKRFRGLWAMLGLIPSFWWPAVMVHISLTCGNSCL